MSKIMVRAAPGRVVRLASGRKVPPAGMMVEESALIRRWIENGDLQILTPIVPTVTVAETAPLKVVAQKPPGTPAEGYKA
jgi:hypothetical protein